MADQGWFQPKGDPYQYRFVDGETIEFVAPDGKTGKFTIEWLNRVAPEWAPKWLGQEAVRAHMPGSAPQADPRTRDVPQDASAAHPGTPVRTVTAQQRFDLSRPTSQTPAEMLVSAQEAHPLGPAAAQPASRPGPPPVSGWEAMRNMVGYAPEAVLAAVAGAYGVPRLVDTIGSIASAISTARDPVAQLVAQTARSVFPRKGLDLVATYSTPEAQALVQRAHNAMSGATGAVDEIAELAARGAGYAGPSEETLAAMSAHREAFYRAARRAALNSLNNVSMLFSLAPTSILDFVVNNDPMKTPQGIY